MNLPIREGTESIQKYFKELADTFADSYATRFIHEKTSIGLPNEELSSIELPSNMTYRNFYCGWCYSCGYKPVTDSKWNFGPVYLFEERPYDEVTYPVGSQGQVCSWSSFRKVSKKKIFQHENTKYVQRRLRRVRRLRNSFQLKKKKNQKVKAQKESEGREDGSVLTCDSNSSSAVSAHNGHH